MENCQLSVLKTGHIEEHRPKRTEYNCNMSLIASKIFILIDWVRDYSTFRRMHICLHVRHPFNLETDIIYKPLSYCKTGSCTINASIQCRDILIKTNNGQTLKLLIKTYSLASV